MPTSAQIAKQITAYDANRKSSADILNDAMGQYGIPELRNRVSGLRTTLTNTEGALNAVDPSVTGRTSRSLVTEAQRQGIVNEERQPIAEQYGSQARLLSDESANLTEQQRAAEMLAQGQISDYSTGRTALQSQYDAQYGREQETQRRKEADRAFNQQKKESDRSYSLAAQRSADNSSKEVDYGANLTNKFKSWFNSYRKSNKGKYPSRQEQDRFVDTWLNSQGVKGSANRQIFWDTINSTFNRVSDPTKDWTWKK